MMSNASGAWGGARLDVAADAAHPLPELAGVDAGKSAGLALDAPAQAGFLAVHWHVPSARRGAAVELCRQDAVPSAEQSCAAPVSAAAVELQPLAEQPDAVLLVVSAAVRKP